MATALTSPPTNLRWARAPFYFNSAAHLIRIGREQATTLGAFLDALRSCPDDAIFHHTFQTLQEHHFIREGFSNDFAHWAFAACNEVGLAERLAAVDVREFTSVKELRERIVGLVEEYLERTPRARDRAALEPFYFCASDTVLIPTPFVARNLQEFAEALQKVSLAAIHYHFIVARLRLGLRSNDFSVWLDEELGLPKVAAQLNNIDIYTQTLNDVRTQVLRVIDRALSA